MAPRPIDRRRWLRAAAGGAAAVVAGLMNCPIAGRAAWCASELEPGVGPADIVAGRPCDGGPCDRESCEGVAAENSSDPADAVDRWSRPFDELLDRFLKETGAPGAALAVARGERLVYVGSRGVADLRSGTPLAPTALFRIASLSKPITAVTLLRLAGRGILSLDERIVDRLKLPAAADPRWRQITLRQLLQHTGGWDRDASFDPMFRAVEIARSQRSPPPAGPQEVIAYMLRRPLDFDPGTRYAYSNFGYCLLGRAIEAATGLEYAAAVQREVLQPLGISRMRLGRTLRPAPDEVRYHTPDGETSPAVRGTIGRRVPPAYGGWNLEAMDANGGWIASAVDLVRFASALSDRDRSPLLTPPLWDEMLAPPAPSVGRDGKEQPPAVHYGCGWNVRRVDAAGERRNFWHHGALPGTSTLLVRRHDGLSWAALFNQREAEGGGLLSTKIDPRLHLAANAVTDWPQHDLFARYLQPPRGTAKMI